MSRQLIAQYQTEVAKVIQYGGSRKETSIRNAFFTLLNHYCQSRNFLLIPELDYKTKTGNKVIPDGTVKDALRLDWGYWESKDTQDNLDKEIKKKLNLGYPTDNILFEDSQTAVLIQAGEEVYRVSFQDIEALDQLLNQFINYTRPEVKDFWEAITAFKEELPLILESLRELIDAQEKTNKAFQTACRKFLSLSQEAINPQITSGDVREMIIQHILTEDIFLNIFNQSQFHRENNIATQLDAVIKTFFTGSLRQNTLALIQRYYAVIKRTAAQISNHQEKQKFLKAVYENFYQAYNPKAADRLGIVYTPGEIVTFMISSCDYLLHQHFNKLLCDPGVEILDPATGTGTFICELIEYLPPDKLKAKYRQEIHANEVAILPYYIANLNIEFTYLQKMGEYVEFENICFVDTLEHTSFEFKQGDLLAMTVENTERIQRQNDRKVSVIIGNPPYNAKQENYSQNNANRTYKEIDNRIKDTYIKQGTAQNQIVIYDMYTRFIRWATDRIAKNGIVAFVTNSSFIDARTFDGFRKIVEQEFSEIYIINLKGNARMSGERRRQEGGNVFSDKIRVGVALYFLVRNQQASGCKIYYHAVGDYISAAEKLQFLRDTKFNRIAFTHIQPDKQSNWINQTDNDFDSLIPLIDKEVKSGTREGAIFQLFSSGVKSQRDEWVYDLSPSNLEAKMRYFVEVYQKTLADNDYPDRDKIKWDADLIKYLDRKIEKHFDSSQIIPCLYRPFYQEYFYFDKHFNGRTYQWFEISRKIDKDNRYIIIPGIASPKNFHTLASNLIVDLNCLPAGCQCLPLYYYDKEGNRCDNITHWGLKQFQNHYQNPAITKQDIFYYTYAVLHHPSYREKYQLNLKREFLRLPFYGDFFKWVEWGKQLMTLHIDYETVTPHPLPRIDLSLHSAMKPKLKADQTQGIIIDDVTTLSGIPPEAWEYMLGNRTAIEWVLEQFKESTVKDSTVAAKFNIYRFADYKEKAILLLQKIVTVSVETVRIIKAMELSTSHKLSC